MSGAPRIAVLLFGSLAGLACARAPFYTLPPEPLRAPAAYAPPPSASDAPSRAAIEFELAWEPVPEEAWGAEDGSAPIADVVYTDPGELPQIVIAGGQERAALRRTDVKAHLRGTVAEVIVQQTFVNDRKAPIEAVYTFPLPENSAVTDMRMVIGERVIEAEIQERQRAAATFEAARRAGHTAALLEQERPNIFTQSLTNIPAGAAIVVELRYLQALSVDAGEVEFVFPAVVGPRFIPGAPTPDPTRGTGTSADTSAVPDASRITPPIAGQGLRAGHDLAIEVIAEGTGPITRWLAPAHQVDVLAAGKRLHVKLADRDKIPNRDFVLRYRSAGARPQAALYLGDADDEGEGAFMLVAEPPRLDLDALVGRREFIFVVDVSGSMRGAPLALAKATMRGALAALRPVDTFDVVTFAGATGRLWDAPRPANLANLQIAAAYVDGLGAAGGTMMADAVDRALQGPVEAGRDRHVFFLTDGFIGNEDEIQRGAAALLAAQAAAGRRARIFGVGLGPSPNSHLIAAISRVGDGVPLYAREPGDVPRIVDTFQRYTDRVVLDAVSIAWGDLAVHETYPAAPASLFAGHPLVIHGRYRGAPPRSLTLSGRSGARTITVPIAVTPAGERDGVLTALWARAKVGELELGHAMARTAAEVDAAVAAIVDVGLRHHLVTAFTSLVAVDRSRVVGDGKPELVVVPVEAPAGVDAPPEPVLRSDHAPATSVRIQPSAEHRYLEITRDPAQALDHSPMGHVEPGAIDLDGERSPSTVKGPPMPREYYDWELHLQASRTRRTPRARVTALALRAAGAPDFDVDAARSEIAAGAELLAHCFLREPRGAYRRLRTLSLTLRWGAAGKIPELRSREDLSEALATCLRDELHYVTAPATPGLTLELSLRVRMKY